MKISKIVFLANEYFPHIVGGAEIVTQTLVEEVSRRGVEVVVITLSTTADDTQDVVNGVKIYRLAIVNLYRPSSGRPSALRKIVWHLRDLSNGRMGRKVGKILDLERPDAFATHNIAGFSTAVWKEAKKRNLRVMHTLHDYYMLCPKTTMFKNGRACVGQCIDCLGFSVPRKQSSSSVDIVVGVSHFVLKEHRDRGFFPNAVSRVIYNGRERTQSRANDFDADSGPLKVGFIGRVEAEKGIEILLAATKVLAPGSVKVIVAGKPTDPGYLDELRSRYAAQDVQYLGFVRTDSFYAGIDILVVPSLWNEPLPTVVFEAMGYGVPVIASRLGGLPELLDDPNTGWLFEAGNSRDLATLLSTIVASRHQLKDMHAACVARRDRYMPERMADEYLALLGAES